MPQQVDDNAVNNSNNSVTFDISDHDIVADSSSQAFNLDDEPEQKPQKVSQPQQKSFDNTPKQQDKPNIANPNNNASNNDSKGGNRDNTPKVENRPTQQQPNPSISTPDPNTNVGKTVNTNELSTQLNKIKDIFNISQTVTNELPKALDKLNSDINTINSNLDKALNDLSNAKSQLENEHKAATSALNGNATEDQLKSVFQDTKEIINQYTAIKQSLTNPKASSGNNSGLPKEVQNLVSEFDNFKTRAETAENKIKQLTEEAVKLQEYVSQYGLKDQVKPDVLPELNGLISAIDDATTHIDENVKANLYTQISSALTNGNSNTLPKELLDTIQNLVIERLESILRPYEELSAKYVAGEINHEQFTEQLRKNALLSLLREKIIDDVTREFENNNLSSNIIPLKLKKAAERMINDARSLHNVMTQQTIPNNTSSGMPSSDTVSSGSFTV